MPDASITQSRPGNSGPAISDYTTGKNSAGIPIVYGGQTDTFRANADLAPGDVVSLVAATATLPLSVDKSAANVLTPAWGVCISTAAAGDDVKVSKLGWCKIGTATSLADNRAISVDASTAGTVADSGAHTALAVTDIGVSHSAVIANFFGATSAILVEFKF